MILALIGIVSIMSVWWGVPLLYIALSEKSSRREKLVWSIAVLFFSWFALIVFSVYRMIKDDDEIDLVN